MINQPGRGDRAVEALGKQARSGGSASVRNLSSATMGGHGRLAYGAFGGVILRDVGDRNSTVTTSPRLQFSWKYVAKGLLP